MLNKSNIFNVSFILSFYYLFDTKRYINDIISYQIIYLYNQTNITIKMKVCIYKRNYNIKLYLKFTVYRWCTSHIIIYTLIYYFWYQYYHKG